MFDTVPPLVGDGGRTAIRTGLTRPAPGVVLLTAHGEVDTLTAPRLDAAISELLQSPEQVLVVDLTGVRFLASSGLAVLIRAASDERRIRIVALGRPVLRPLQITGTDSLFELHTDLATALETDSD